MLFNSKAHDTIRPMIHDPEIQRSQPFRRAVIWILVAVYTYLLPSFYLIYRAILDNYGKEVVGRVPLLIVAVFGIAYSAAVLRVHKDPKYLLFLIPCGIIAAVIMRLEPNPNKHIHIPQYIVMAWLLYAAISKDYKGKGLFILIFFYTSLLGIVDELEQGIHPSRFYGWSDMLVNSSSGIVGIFTILGLKTVDPGDWAWAGYLRKYKPMILLILVGIIGAAAMLVMLFQVQAAEVFEGVYPEWLKIWNLSFVILAPLMVVIHYILFRSHDRSSLIEKGFSADMTARQWVYPLLGILWYMHALLVFVALSSTLFE